MKRPQTRNILLQTHNFMLILAFSFSCPGSVAADIFPNDRISVEGVPFYVIDTFASVTIHNFETGLTEPNHPMALAGQAAVILTGCNLLSSPRKPA